MKVAINAAQTINFNSIPAGECFLYGGKTYLKLNVFIDLAPNQSSVDQATKDLKGYNTVRFEDGRPGSFQEDTRVTPMKLMVVSTPNG